MGQDGEEISVYLDFHTHGKLAKRLPFSTAYTDWPAGHRASVNLFSGRVAAGGG